MLEYINDNLNVDGVELNLSCPNIVGKPQIGYDFENMEEVIRKYNEIMDGLTCGIKLPPYFDISHFNNACDIINNTNLDFITCINSIGNGLIVDYVTETPVIYPNNGYGGIGGASIKSTALANVNYFYKHTKCDIVGCGGITSGIDAFEHILCGASAIQLGTYFYQYKHNTFSSISNILSSIMRFKNYKTIDDFKGTLS
jgi:dihydroorotate dehydrogenase (fumarate)